MGFLELRRQCGVSHEVRCGAQGASHVVPGKSDLHARGEGASVLCLQQRGAGRPRPRPFSSGGVQGARLNSGAT